MTGENLEKGRGVHYQLCNKTGLQFDLRPEVEFLVKKVMSREGVSREFGLSYL